MPHNLSPSNFQLHESRPNAAQPTGLKTAIPELILLTPAAVHDANARDLISFEADSVYVLDKDFMDFERPYRIHKAEAFFIPSAKYNLNFRRWYSGAVNKATGVLCDQTIRLNSHDASKDYSEKFRRIKFCDEESGNVLVFLTNNFFLTAPNVVQSYQHRWKIEIFFEWIKQHLKIKSFWGHFKNAVKTKVWIAVSVHLLVVIA